MIIDVLTGCCLAFAATCITAATKNSKKLTWLSIIIGSITIAVSIIKG